jgi:hypothetical protein
MKESRGLFQLLAIPEFIGRWEGFKGVKEEDIL